MSTPDATQDVVAPSTHPLQTSWQGLASPLVIPEGSSPWSHRAHLGRPTASCTHHSCCRLHRQPCTCFLSPGTPSTPEHSATWPPVPGMMCGHRQSGLSLKYDVRGKKTGWEKGSEDYWASHFQFPDSLLWPRRRARPYISYGGVCVCVHRGGRGCPLPQLLI